MFVVSYLSLGRSPYRHAFFERCSLEYHYACLWYLAVSTYFIAYGTVCPVTKENWYDTITNQNYFSNNGKILIQHEGLAVGAPTSGTIAEFFLQH